MAMTIHLMVSILCLLRFEAGYVPMDCYWTDYVNENRGIHDIELRDEYFLSGMISTYIAYYDRRFKWYLCRPADGFSRLSEDNQYSLASIGYYSTVSSYCSTTSTDSGTRYTDAMVGAYSTFYSSDRAWTFKCNTLHPYHELVDCAIHYYANDWRTDGDFVCPSNGVVRGIYAYYYSSYGDRLYALTCCRVRSVIFGGDVARSSYFVGDEKMPFSEAESFCQSAGTHLASIHSESDLLDIQNVCSLVSSANALPTPLLYIAGKATELNECEGDCDRDEDCVGDLLCFQRDEDGPMPPGCDGTPNEGTDFCYYPGADAGCIIGLYQFSGSDPWKWTDGTYIDYGFTSNGEATQGIRPWDDEQPGYRNGQICTKVFKSDLLHDFSCEAEDNYPICNKFLGVITIKSCDGWNYGSGSNSLRVRLAGEGGSSPVFIANKYSSLPINGNSECYNIELAPDFAVNPIYSVMLDLDDPEGYCIEELSLSVLQPNPENSTTAIYNYTFSSSDYFGSGIILASECQYSYRFVSKEKPLIPCKSDSFTLRTYRERGIYTVDIHTCLAPDSAGISAQSMVDNLYGVIMGKPWEQAAYATTAITFLDHCAPSTVDVHQVGNVIAFNVLIKTEASNALYVKSESEGTLIGIKIESVNYRKYSIPDLTINVKIDSSIIQIYDTAVFENGRYLFAFFKNDYRVTITTSSEIYIYSEEYDDFEANVYVILENHENMYQLPFIIKDADSRNWFDANEACLDEFGTTLVSIHSEEENFFINGMLGETSGESWIGIFDSREREQNNWGWIDRSALEYTYWDSDASAFTYPKDCGKMLATGKWDGDDCSDTDKTNIICGSPQWTPLTHRIFEFNDETAMTDIVLMSIGNNNVEDDICIDSVTIDGETHQYLSGTTIGGDISLLISVFQYPVCATEVVGIRVDKESLKTNIIDQDSSIVGLECQNNNRMVPSTCSISQSYQMSQTTSFAISNSKSSTDTYSWGQTSSVTLSTSRTKSESSTQSDTQSNSKSTSDSFSIGAEAGGGFFGMGSWKLTTEYSKSWSRSTSNSYTNSVSTGSSQTDSRSDSNSQNEQNSNSDTLSEGYTSAYSNSETVSVACSGQATTPPSHSMSYSLIFSAYNTTIDTYTDLRLTLCSAFLSPETDESDVESHYIYIENVPGTVTQKEVTSCEVQFGPTEYVRNDLSCGEELTLAISSGSTFLPQCDSSNEEFYAPCQCDIGDLKTLGQCWCVDRTGNRVGKAVYVPNEVAFDDIHDRICVEELSCEYNATAAMGAHANGIDLLIHSPKQMKEIIQTPKGADNSTIWFIVSCVLAVSLLTVVSLTVLKCCGAPKGYIYSKDLADTDEEEDAV